MESQYDAVGENVFLHRMELNAQLVTKSALIRNVIHSHIFSYTQ